MPVTTAQIDAIPDYTSAQQLKMWKKVSMDLTVAGVSYAIHNRTLTRANASEVMKMIDFWQDQVAAEDSTSGNGLALVKFGERQ